MLDISGWEFLTLGIIAVIIFGPDKLPKFAADAGRFLKQVRNYVNGAKDELTRELGPEFADVKVSDLTPRGMMKKALGPEDPFEELKNSVDIRKDVDQFRDLRNPMQFAVPPRDADGEDEADAGTSLRAPGSRGAAAATAASASNGVTPQVSVTPPSRSLAENEPPPFDLDAT